MHPSLKSIWQTQNVRSVVLLSLFLQVLLVLYGPMRKRKKGFLTLFIWWAYLLADWTAGYAVGLLSSGEGKRHILDEDLAAFWAPFLLVHLGGQDTVTAFSFEDNQLWRRRLLELLVHLGLVAYAFYRTIPNRFWISTVLMFCAGTIKYAERTCALYLASLPVFEAHVLPMPDPGPDYAQLMEEYSSYMKAGVPAGFIIKKELGDMPLEYKELEEPINEIEVVKSGYKFYKIFRGLMVDLVLSLPERNESREFFFRRNFRDAFKVMEVELNFMYDAFYTKMNVVHRKIGYFFRFFCYLLIAISFYRFVTFHEHEFQPEDVAVSYTLLAGAIGLDFIALAMSVFSDWTLAWVKNPTALRILEWIRQRFPFNRSRWSNSMSQHNLISYCLEERPLWLDNAAGFFGLRETLDEFLCNERYTVDDDLKKFIFNELKEKAIEGSSVETAKEIWSSKGNWVLSRLLLSIQKSTMGHKSECSEVNMLERVPTTGEGHESECPETIISESVSDQVEFDESILRWHIATELCYWNDNNMNLDEKDQSCRRFSKRISDYIVYLLVMRRTTMSAVAGIGKIRFADSCEEAKRFFRRGGKNEILKPKNGRQSFMNFLKQIWSDKAEMKRNACMELLSVVIPLNPVVIKGKSSQSLLFDGCRLAKALIDISPIPIDAHGPGKRWEIMSKVWVELLAYAATHSRPDAHGQQLSKGGELLTFVWLLMAHLGLGEQFRFKAWTKLKAQPP